MRRLKKFGMSAKTLKNFYRCTIESIFPGGITTWYGSCSAADRKALQRVKRAERIIGGHLPFGQGIYNNRCLRKARNIAKDHSHPGYGLYCCRLVDATGASEHRLPESQTVFTPRLLGC